MFERFHERIHNINAVLQTYRVSDLHEALEAYAHSGINVDQLVDNIQPFACQDTRYAFKIIVGICVKNALTNTEAIATCVGNVLQAFCVDGSVAQKRKIGLGHGELAKQLLSEENDSFAFVAGHESFAAAEGALSIAKYANACRKKPLKVVLVGLGKPVAEIIARYQGFDYIPTRYNYNTGKLSVDEVSTTVSQRVRCFGAHSIDEGVAILHHEDIRIIMTGNSTNHVKFTDPTVATYKKEVHEKGKQVYCIASGGGTGRTMHPDNVQSGAASYGMTDSLGRTHSNVQFAGSSSVPSHVQMVGFIGIGNNPLVGLSIATIAKIKEVLS